MAYAIKVEVVDPRARTFAFTAHKTMYGGKLIAIALMAFAISALSAGSAAAAEIRVLALQSPQIVMAEVGAEFERKTGHTLTQLLRRTDMPPEANRRIDSGEAFDVAFVLPPMMDLLITQGKIIADTRTHFLRIGIGVAVRAGAVKPDISSVDAIKRALLNAKTIAYLQGGASGPYLAALIERLGISRELQPKTLRPDMDIVGDLVARGEADIGMTAISTLLATPGIEVVGPLPQEIQSYVYFEGGIATNASAPDAARALLKFLTERSTVRVIKSKGMETW
jgi:molybdate transport system substrate-binding protein